MGLVFLGCFGWFRFGMERPSAKLVFFQVWPLKKEKNNFNYCCNMLLANQTNTKTVLNPKD